MPPPTPLFQVYLRLRPPIPAAISKPVQNEPWLIVEPSSPIAEDSSAQLDTNSNPPKPTHIILQPPSDSRKRAVEKFGFTKVFQEDASQLSVFQETGASDLANSVLNEGRDGLVATLGVTGSGKVVMKSRVGKQKLTSSRVILSLDPKQNEELHNSRLTLYSARSVTVFGVRITLTCPPTTSFY